MAFAAWERELKPGRSNRFWIERVKNLHAADGGVGWALNLLTAANT